MGKQLEKKKETCLLQVQGTGGRHDGFLVDVDAG
jgi:hypothetical protein